MHYSGLSPVFLSLRRLSAVLLPLRPRSDRHITRPPGRSSTPPRADRSQPRIRARSPSRSSTTTATRSCRSTRSAPAELVDRREGPAHPNRRSRRPVCPRAPSSPWNAEGGSSASQPPNGDQAEAPHQPVRPRRPSARSEARDRVSRLGRLDTARRGALRAIPSGDLPDGRQRDALERSSNATWGLRSRTLNWADIPTFGM